MVHIFTPQELSSRQVPTKQDYDEASRIAREELALLVKEGIVIGALFYGSIVQNDGCVGSDYRCVYCFKIGWRNRVKTVCSTKNREFRRKG